MSDADDGATASATISGLSSSTSSLTGSATAFSKAMTQAFASSITGGKQLDDVLKSLTLRLSDLAVKMALKPVESALTGGLQSLLSGLIGGGSGASLQGNAGAIRTFAAGGVIGTPSYFPMQGGGLGLAGESGPEAIMPLQRGADGRLGVAGQGGGNTISVQIATPDVDSFRRSESYITGQIARAVARGQRSL